MSEPEQAASVVTFLFTEAASAVHGCTIPVEDGFQVFKNSCTSSFNKMRSGSGAGLFLPCPLRSGRFAASLGGAVRAAGITVLASRAVIG